jgi:2'-5' RNA ligase
MRLFFAIDPDPSAREQLSREIAGVRASLGSGADHWRWVGADLVHVTLHFLGELDDAAETRVRAAAGFSIPRPPFDVAVSTLGTFPPRRAPKVLWLGLTAGVESLAEVHRDLAGRLAGADAGFTPRPFSPHLTIARARRVPRAETPAATSIAPIVWRVDRVTLYASDLSGAAPRYTPRHVVRLADAP